MHEQLKKLCQRLEPYLQHLILCTHTSIIGRALMEHVDEAQSKSWSLPDLESLGPDEKPEGPARLEVGICFKMFL